MRFSLFLLAFLFTQFVKGQADDILATIEWSNPLLKKYVEVVKTDSNYIYYAGIEKKNLFNYDQVIGRLNKDDLEKDLEIVKDAEKYKGAYPQVLGYKVRHGQLHGYFEHYDKKNDVHTILARKLLDENRKMGPYKVLGELDSKRRSKGDLDYSWSENDSLLLLFGNPPLKDKNAVERVQITLLNYDYEPMYEAEIELSFADKYFAIRDYEVTNKGDILMLGYKIPNPKKGEKKNRKKSNQAFYLYVLDQKSGEIIEYNLGLDDKFISNIELSCDFDNNTSVLHGIYGDTEFGSMSGTFYISIDQSTYEVINSKFNPFDKDFKKLMARSKREKKKIEKGKEDEIENVDVVLRHVIRKKDGGHLVVFEDYDHWVVTTRGPNGGYSNTDHYHYKDIFVQNYSSDGEVIWTAFLPKNQKSTDDFGRWSGFMLVVDKDRLHFIYNDHPKNEERWGTEDEIKKLTKFKKANLAMVTLSEEGSLEYNVLMPSSNEKFLISPSRSKMFSEENSNSGVITSHNKNSTRLGKLELFFD